MRVLLLYKDPGQTRPLRVIAKDLHSRGIELIDHNCRTMEDVRNQLHNAADLIVCHQALVSGCLSHEAPILIQERIDGAQLAESRGWIEQYPRIRGVMKGYRLKPASLNNEHKGRFTAYLLKKSGVRATKGSMVSASPPAPLSDAALRRIYLMYGFGAYDHLKPPEAAEIDFDARRPLDTHFVATLGYSGSEIETHRRLALRATSRYSSPKFCSEHKVKYRFYCERMLESKTVVSPWGCGEACHRDYEAMLFGAVLIKPRTDHVDCWPDIYRAGETYLPCKLDFSDLHQVVGNVRDNWGSFREWRVRCRELILESRTRDYLADRMAAVFEKALQ